MVKVFLVNSHKINMRAGVELSPVEEIPLSRPYGTNGSSYLFL